MAFRIRDLSIHLLPDTGAGNCTCTPASPQPKAPCPGPTCKDSGPQPNPPRGGNKPPKPGGTPKKRSGLATLQAQLRESLAPPPR
jgi:hypothetical protein